MTITSTQMSAILKSRKLGVLPVRKGSTVEWTCKTVDDTRATGTNNTFSTPEEAVEAADINLSQAELREKERSAQSVIELLEKGKYQVKKDPGGTFSIITASGSITPITGRPNIIQAVLDAEAEGLGK